jgi:hypothetical protein
MARLTSEGAGDHDTETQDVMEDAWEARRLLVYEAGIVTADSAACHPRLGGIAQARLGMSNAFLTDVVFALDPSSVAPINTSRVGSVWAVARATYYETRERTVSFRLAQRRDSSLGPLVLGAFS